MRQRLTIVVAGFLCLLMLGAVVYALHLQLVAVIVWALAVLGIAIHLFNWRNARQHARRI
jgi:hypothetical protein